MNIKYTDLGREVTSAQAILLPNYHKVFYGTNGFIKQTEKYENRVLYDVEYYKDFGESEEDALALLRPLNVPFGIREIESYGSYHVIIENSYYENQLFKKWRLLRDPDGDTICIQELDLNVGLPLLETTYKYLGKYEDEYSTDYCKFRYRDDGSFWYCDYNYMHEYDNDTFNIGRLPWIKDLFQLSDNMYNYYLTADLLPPLSD